MQTKKCSKCGEEKSINEFYKKKKLKDGLDSWCKNCNWECTKLYIQKNSERRKQWMKEYGKQFREDNPEYEKERHKIYYKENKQKLSEYCEQWYKNNKEHVRQYQKNRIEITRQYKKDNTKKIKLRTREWYKKNPNYKKLRYRNIYCKDVRYCLNRALRGGIANSLRDGKNGKSWEKIIGYNLRDLMAYLENRFKKGMSFDNYGKWHIDHIIPISLWKFNSYDDKEFKQCWALANLQPLWANENISKGNRI